MYAACLKVTIYNLRQTITAGDFLPAK